jgi:cysteine desulfurase
VRATGRIYADHAATTPVRAEVLEAMLPHLGRGFNPSSVHAEGRAARAALDEARALVARLLGATPREIVFTGGGTEADNLAILGLARARGRPAHALTAAAEHRAVLRAFDALRDDGWEVTVLEVDSDGRVAPAAFRAALRPETAFASIMLANNEIGTLNPIAELVQIARGRGVLLHTDAIQAAGRLPLEVAVLGSDLLSLSAHKFSGPKGVGALYVRSGTPVAPRVVGGGQEAGLRSGTEDVAGIAGFARALELAVAELPAEAARLSALRDRFEAGLAAAVPGTRINGSGAARLPNISSVGFAGVEAATAVIRLDLEGVSVSAGSACAAGSTEPSHVLAAIGAPAWARTGTIRFSFGKLTDDADVEALVEALPAVVAALRDEPAEVGTTGLGSDASRWEVRS